MTKTIKRSKILIIEDSPTQSAIIADVVRQAGHEPAVYNTLPAGVVQVLEKEEPDLVLLDLRLLDAQGNPVADGFQICREIKRARAQLPVVIISAEGDDEACEWAVLQGADAYLQKPFAVSDLKDIMSQVLKS